jgi:hypothetical protein
MTWQLRSLFTRVLIFAALPVSAFLQRSLIPPSSNNCYRYHPSRLPLFKLKSYHDEFIVDPSLSVDLPLSQGSIMDTNSVGNSHTTDVAVFIIGVIPFLWATIEFWRRIAMQLPFGTGSDSVVVSLGEDDNPSKLRGRRTLGKGALIVAYILFGMAISVVGISLLSILLSSSSQLPP